VRYRERDQIALRPEISGKRKEVFVLSNGHAGTSAATSTVLGVEDRSADRVRGSGVAELTPTLNVSETSRYLTHFHSLHEVFEAQAGLCSDTVVVLLDREKTTYAGRIAWQLGARGAWHRSPAQLPLAVREPEDQLPKCLAPEARLLSEWLERGGPDQSMN
jgi:hypothetical protein